ncbi:MAG: hypothetical protein EBU36_03135 [Verrucomicrobia bacterium]|nr:hypothetical protein [Verrucomicrobiota bacterium]
MHLHTTGCNVGSVSNPQPHFQQGKMKIISWNCNGIKHNWNTIFSLLQTYEPEYLCIQNYRQHQFIMPKFVDIGLPKDEEIPDGEKVPPDARDRV